MALEIKPDTSDDEVTALSPEEEGMALPVYPETKPESPDNAPSSPLGDIKGKRAEFLTRMHKDVLVPRWNPANNLPYLFVRLRPISQIELLNAIKKRQDEYDEQVRKHEQPPEDSGIRANADLVAMATKGIYCLANDTDPTKYSVTGSTDESKWTKFDGSSGPLTAEHLGIAFDPRDPVASLVRGVFNDTDGDLLWFTNRLLEFSNLSNSEADTAF